MLASDYPFLDVVWTMRIDRIRTGLFCCRNVRASDNDLLDFGRCARCALRRRRNRLRENPGSNQQIDADGSGEGRRS